MVQTRPRGPAPHELTSNQAKWTERWKELPAGNKADWLPNKAARLRLREALLALTHGKCAFCERLLDDSSWVAVEHYHPKARYRDLAFEWTNLLPACSICNSVKSNQDHQGALLKPDEEDPEPFFWLNVGNGHLEPHPALTSEQAARVHATIDLCGLQRPVLCKRRFRMVQRVGRWINSALLGEPDHEEWEDLIDPETEHKFVLRFMLESRNLNSRARADRKRFEKD